MAEWSLSLLYLLSTSCCSTFKHNANFPISPWTEKPDLLVVDKLVELYLSLFVSTRLTLKLSMYQCFRHQIMYKVSQNQNWNYLYFQVSPLSHSISYVRSCRPFVVLTSSAGLVGCRRCKNDERPTGTNITNWKGRRWNLKIKVIPVSIITEIYPLVHKTWYLKQSFIVWTN